jgi:oxygen-independent coproporphyrinogen-3 oxidase
VSHAGVYIHIPFCRSRCSYCDFATGMYESALATRYVGAVAQEIRQWREVELPARVDTIYFGGGTPSLLSPAQVEQILLAVHDRFDVLSGAEVTLEMNPASANENLHHRDTENTEVAQRNLAQTAELPRQKLNELRSLGINRASFGAQTFDDDQLRRLGRTHTSNDIRSTFRHLREAGFDNINFDLIAGLPRQTLADWSRNLEEALALRPEHLSLYLLDVHEGTPLADQITRGTQPAPDDDLAAEMYTRMIDRVCAAGYEHYEISNFCLAGFESRHNTKYWTGAPYYGFGCSAHSYDGAFRRWANEREAMAYVEAIESGRSPVVERVQLSEGELRAESMFLGLRMMSGVDMRTYHNRFGADPREEYSDEMSRFQDAGLIEINDDLIKLTRTGALLSNEVFAAFVSEPPAVAGG